MYLLIGDVWYLSNIFDFDEEGGVSSSTSSTWIWNVIKGLVAVPCFSFWKERKSGVNSYPSNKKEKKKESEREKEVPWTTNSWCRSSSWAYKMRWTTDPWCGFHLYKYITLKGLFTSFHHQFSANLCQKMWRRVLAPVFPKLQSLPLSFWTGIWRRRLEWAVRNSDGDFVKGLSGECGLLQGNGTCSLWRPWTWSHFIKQIINLNSQCY